VATIPLTNPTPASDALANMIYIGNSSGVSVINGTTNKVVASINLFGPSRIDVNERTGMVYVAASDKVYVINGTTNKVVDSITTGVSLNEGLAVNSRSNITYVSDSFNNVVWMIDANSNKVI
ncbi:MAG: hypothetical protein WAM14_11710, partial [Candidatus Nitrosopolaris sp.]